jgi:hypothetical protein
MAYKVIKYFNDMQDGNFAYEVNSPYPREGLSVLPSRIKELAGSDNRQGCPLIVEVPDEEEPKKKKSAKKTDEE